MRRQAAGPRNADGEQARPAARPDDVQTTASSGPDPALLGAAAAWAPANSPVRSDLILQLQRTYGNAAAGRMVQAFQADAARPPVAVQRDTPPGRTATHAARPLARVHVEFSQQSPVTLAVHQFSYGTGSGESGPDELTVATEIGSGSEEVFRALTSDEVVKTLILDVLRTDKEGKEHVVHTLTLHDVRVVAVKTAIPESRTKHAQQDDTLELLWITFGRAAAKAGGRKTAAPAPATPK